MSQFPLNKKKAALLTAALGFILSMSAVSQANVNIQAFDWQARLKYLLPKDARELCLNAAEELLSDDMVLPEAMEEKIKGLNIELPSAPLNLCAAVRILIKKDAETTALEKKIKAQKEGERLLKDYTDSIKEMRRQYKGTEAQPEISSKINAYPKNAVSDKGTEVIRFFPAPEKTWSDKTAAKFTKAAEEDSAMLKCEYEKNTEALKQKKANCRLWHEYVYTLGKKLDPNTGLEKEADLTEQEYVREHTAPAPPFDLKTIQPDTSESRQL